jgi:Transposase DDE domain
MERERWNELYALAGRLGKSIVGGYVYDVVCIVGVYFWAVVHDRPVSWACEKRNWPADLVRWGLPSQPTMSRRLRTAAVRQLLAAIEDAMRQDANSAAVKLIDAKPLMVGGYSKDKDAKWGRAAGGFWKGYKVYALWGGGPLPIAWRVNSMNVSEERMARKLIPHLSGEGYVVGDNVYDSNTLYDMAGARRHQLLAPRQKPEAGLGHRRQSPHRLRSLEIQKTDLGKQLFRKRNDIERRFGHWTNFGGGLAPLPNWVRTLPRAQLWIHAKLLINAVRIRKKQRNIQPAFA